MKALLIIAKEGYRDEEYEVPKKILEAADIEVVTASKDVGECKGKLGGTAEATLTIADVNVSDYDAVVFIGGPGSAQYQEDVQAHLTAQEAVNRRKLLAAICIAPAILANAEVLEGKKATIWNGDGKHAGILEKNGAIFVDEPVVVDGRIITANGPEAAEEFGKKIVEMLK